MGSCGLLIRFFFLVRWFFFFPVRVLLGTRHFLDLRAFMHSCVDCGLFVLLVEYLSVCIGLGRDFEWT